MHRDSSDIEMEDDDEEKAMAIDDGGGTADRRAPPHSMGNDVIAGTITRCLRRHRPFDLNYKMVTAEGLEKNIKIRYISLEHTALVVVNARDLQQCHLPAPRVRVALSTFINDRGDIRNLSGRHSLIRLLCENIVRRAHDPLATTSNALGLMNSKVFSMDVLLLLFGFMEWRDLLNFGYCSQIAYGLSTRPELWRSAFERRFGNTGTQDIANWKQQFLIQHIRQRECGWHCTLCTFLNTQNEPFISSGYERCCWGLSHRYLQRQHLAKAHEDDAAGDTAAKHHGQFFLQCPACGPPRGPGSDAKHR